MKDLPRQVLRRIVAKYGNDLGGNARRCEGLLKDLCGEYRREISVLTSAVEERIPLDLLAAGSSLPRELLLTKLAKRLEDNLGLMPEAAHWAVESWALALGVVTEEEIEAEERNQAVKSVSAFEKPYAENSGLQPSSQNRQSPILPRQPHVNPQMPSLQPFSPDANVPVNIPARVPHQPAQKSTSTINIPQSLLQQNTQAANPAPRKYFRGFFGCLFVFFLFIVTGIILLFGVPYAISVMRETQQQNEPPRFPAR